VAEELSRRFNFAVAHIRAGLERARHPGRLERQGRYLFDGAHNVAGARSLAEYIDEYIDEPITMVFGAMQDKDYREMLAILTPKVRRFVLAEPTSSRALGIEALLDAVPEDREANSARAVSSALTLAEALTPEGGVILVTGSLYLVGEAKKLLNN
jgi:dihydrofolate synthase/folylpolyglutamate synthase